jgi:thiamine-monophosphate kinase
MECPEPRVALGQALRGIASSAIDLSDGLVGDLGHVLRRSRVGATLQLDRLPRSDVLAAQPEPLQTQCLLAGGDDYELLFSAPPAQREAVQRAGVETGVAVTRIGQLDAEPGLRVLDRQGRLLPALAGFDHFK